jgi:hypothetical protein
MADNREAFRRSRVTYFPYVELPGHPDGLLDLLAPHAAIVVCDDHPAFTVNRLTEAAVARIPVRFDAVNANGSSRLRAFFPERPLRDPLAAPSARGAPGTPAEVVRRCRHVPAAPELAGRVCRRAARLQPVRPATRRLRPVRAAAVLGPDHPWPPRNGSSSRDVFTRTVRGRRDARCVRPAAQGELIVEGRIQNYLRMLLGKKILEWSPTP